MNDFDPNPDANNAKIVFVIFAFFMAMYLIFSYHMKTVHAQDFPQNNSSQEDPLKDLYYSNDEDPLIGIIKKHNEIDYHFSPENPLYKEGYELHNWRSHHDYKYFVWVEADHKPTLQELEQLEYDKILTQRKIETAVKHNLVHCVRAIDELGVLNPHCTNAPYGCDERIHVLVGYIVDVAYSLNLDPWLLTAIAMHESTFNPFAKGSVGERGIFQINPRIPLGKRIKFVRSERYRRHCKKKLGACQKEIVEAAGIHLYKDLKVCKYNVRRSLTKYNTGQCTIKGKPRWKYVKSVLRHKMKLLKGKPAVKWCDPNRSGKTKDYYL